ncbi:hypothetical protein [Streptomyces sp. NPDC059874]|uniref:hypothetical protein n=1 Tax=Streptomyces sp. NPDC059874 TaxID=3346983 RepID=UPI00365EA037
MSRSRNRTSWPDEEDQDPEAAAELLVPVSPEASVRLRVLPKRVAIARTDETAKQVRESTGLPAYVCVLVRVMRTK